MAVRAGIQYASGLYAHRGWRQAWSALVPGAAPTLALLGNCGSVGTADERRETLEFLRRCAATWEQVLWIPGPEELRSAAGEKVIYPYQLYSLEDLAKEAEGEWGSIELLNQGEIWNRKAKAVFLGATGWGPGLGLSKVPAGGPESEIFISTEGSIVPVRLEDLAEWHSQDVVWLEDRIKWWRTHHPDTRIVILTHTLCAGHLLSQSLPRNYYGRFPLDCMPVYSSDALLRNPGVYAWLCGATGGAVSGFTAGRGAARQHRVYTAVNSASGGGEGGQRNPQYDPARRLELR